MFQECFVTTEKETGAIFLTHLLRHELGPWASLSHHSSKIDNMPKIICSMRSITNKFCVFCMDAKSRMSFISYYRALEEVNPKNPEIVSEHYDMLNIALQLFYS